MTRYRTIAPTCLPMRSPFLATIVYTLLLDRLDAPGWVWGVAGTFMVLLWLAWGIAEWNNDSQLVAGFGEIPAKRKTD